MALDFTFLTEEQIWGDESGNGQLDVMKKYGTAAASTDLAVLLGGHMTNSNNRTSERELTCLSWASSSSKHGDPRVVDCYGHRNLTAAYARVFSVRPALPPSEASKISSYKTKSTVSGCQVAEYGEYPQTVVDDRTSKTLEILHRSGLLSPTGKDYTFDSVGLTGYDTPFKATTYPEYELDGKRYICVLGNPTDSNSRLSTGEQVEKGKSYWVRVQPIEWLIDSNGTMVAKKCLFSGIQFDTEVLYDGDFSKTFIKKYLDTYFAKEIETPAEREKRLKREETITGLKAKLAEAIDPEKVKAKVGFTRTDSRREIVKAIKTTRRARDVFIAAAKKAQKEGDQELIDQIVEMADFYVRSDQAQRRAARQRRAEYRAKRAAAKKDSER